MAFITMGVYGSRYYLVWKIAAGVRLHVMVLCVVEGKGIPRVPRWLHGVMLSLPAIPAYLNTPRTHTVP